MSGNRSGLSTDEHDKFFEQYMNESLRLEEIKIKKKEGGGSITDRQESDIKYNTDRKGAILKTYVIKSMANLTYFFKFINEHPELIINFDKEIEKIFGLNMPLDSRKAPFTRMLMEFVGEGVHSPGEDNLAGYLAMDPRFNFRVRLLNMMQLVIRLKADWVSMNLNDPPTPNDLEMRSMLIGDLKRAQVWMGYLNQSITRIPNKEKKIKPNAKTVISKSNYTKELDEKVRQEFRRNKKSKLIPS
jgi:hypothetical protein